MGYSFEFMPEDEYRKWQGETFRRSGEAAIFRKLGQKLITSRPPARPPEDPAEPLTYSPAPSISGPVNLTSGYTSPTVSLPAPPLPNEPEPGTPIPAFLPRPTQPGEALGLNPREYQDLIRAKEESDRLRTETTNPPEYPIQGPRYGTSALGEQSDRHDIATGLQGIQRWGREQNERYSQMLTSGSAPEVAQVGVETFPGAGSIGAVGIGLAGLARQVTRGAGQAARATTVVDDALTKLTQLVRAAEPATIETQALRHEELGRRVGAAAGILEGGQGRTAFQRAKAPLKGEQPKAQFTPPQSDLTPDEIDDLFERIRSSSGQFFTKLDTAEALEKVMLGQIPTRGEIALLESTFGRDLPQALLSRRPFGEKLWENVREVINLPRTLLASWDVSAPLRQGAILAPSHPKEWAGGLVPMFRALASEEYAQVVDDAIRSGHYAPLREEAGLYLAPRTQATAQATQREEQFMSKFAQLIPGIKQSERAYVTFLNKFRADVFDNIVTGWEGTGKTAADYKRLASFINAATGRGGLGPLEGVGDVLSAGFFAPRYRMSRIQVWGSLLSPSAPVRKEAAKSLVSFVGTGVGILSLVKLSGLGDVETDPRSSDFGKIQVGPLHIDFWASEQQLARMIANLITGEKKTGAGKVIEQNRLETLGKYMETALSPQAGLTTDLLRGSDFLGRPMEGTPEGMAEQARSRLVPLAIQDIVEASQAYATPGAVIGAAAFAGVGVQTIPESPSAKIVRVKDDAARGTFGKAWDELTPTQQAQLTEDRPEITQAIKGAAHERELAPNIFPSKDAVEAAKYLESKLDRPVLKEMERLGIRIAPLDRSIGEQGYYLPDAQWKQYQDSLASAWNTAIPTVIDSPAYAGSPLPDRAQMLGDARSNTAKAVRESILSDKPMTPAQVTATAKEVATAASLMGQYRQMPHYIIGLTREDEKATAEAIQRIQERERMLPPVLKNKRSFAILEESQAANTDEDRRILSNAVIILKNPGKFTNPARRQFWYQNGPLLQKYYGRVDLEEE